jgi:hypothetical protein
VDADTGARPHIGGATIRHTAAAGDHCTARARRWAVWVIIGAQVAYPVVFLDLALVKGWHGAATGVVLIGIPLTATIIIGLAVFLTDLALRGYVSAGVALVLGLGLLAVNWFALAARETYRPNRAEELIGAILGVANVVAVAGAVLLTGLAWRTRRTQ